jgi:hypothetical protein
MNADRARKALVTFAVATRSAPAARNRDQRAEPREGA